MSLKINVKTTEEIFAEQSLKLKELEQYLSQVLEFLKKQKEDFLAEKEENLGRIISLEKAIKKRDDLMEEQALLLRKIAIDFKNGNGGGMSEDDWKYIVNLIDKKIGGKR